MDRHSEEQKNALSARRHCDSGNESVADVNGIENTVEKKKRRLEQIMRERGELEDDIDKRRKENHQFYEWMRVENFQAAKRRAKLNREIKKARESLLEDGEGISFEGLPDDILYRIVSFLPFEDRMKARFINRRMEKKACRAMKMTPWCCLEITVEEANSLSFLLHQKHSNMDDSSSDSSCDGDPIHLSFENLSFSSALEVMRILGQTVDVENLCIDKFCHLSDSDRSLLLEMTIRMNCVSHFIRCYGQERHLCDSKKNTGPIPFSLLRPMIERAKGTVKINCPVQVTIEELDFIHENVMKQIQNDGVFIRVVDSNVAEGYKKHLKETSLSTDKVFTRTNNGLRGLHGRLNRQEMVRVRICPDNGYFTGGVYYGNDEFARAVLQTTVLKYEARGQVTIDVEFVRKYKYLTDGLAHTHQTV